MTPRNWDVNGWSVDCLPGPVVAVRRACALASCRFVASASDDAGADDALFEHHVALHLPNAEYVMHTQRHI